MNRALPTGYNGHSYQQILWLLFVLILAVTVLAMAAPARGLALQAGDARQVAVAPASSLSPAAEPRPSGVTNAICRDLCLDSR